MLHWRFIIRAALFENETYFLELQRVSIKDGHWFKTTENYAISFFFSNKII